MTFFYARLNYIMSLVDIKNSDLSKKLFVDSSLVSRWKTGKRVPSENNIHNISAAIIEFCDTYKKRNALCKGININYSDEYFNVHFKTLEYYLFLWLTKDSDYESEDLEINFLQESLKTSVYSERPTIFSGDAGAKYCLNMLMDTAIKRGEPFTIFLFSNSSLEWLVNDEEYFESFRKLLDKARILKANVKIVYHATNKPVLASCYAKLWSEMQKLDNSELYGLAIRENVMRQFTQLLIVIPEVGVIHGWQHVASPNKYILYLSDERFVKQITDDCGQLLLKCEPLLVSSRQYSYEEMVENIMDKTGKRFDMLYHSSYLSYSTMPASVLKKMLTNAGFSEDKIKNYLKIHKKYTTWFANYIKNGRIEYYYMHNRKDDGNHVVSHSDILFGEELRYTPELYREHLHNIVKLLEEEIKNNSNFNFYLIPQPLYSSDIMIEYNSYLMSYDINSSNGISVCLNQHFLNNVQDYISEESRKLSQDVFPQQRNLKILKELMNELKV